MKIAEYSRNKLDLFKSKKEKADNDFKLAKRLYDIANLIQSGDPPEHQLYSLVVEVSQVVKAIQSDIYLLFLISLFLL